MTYMFILKCALKLVLKNILYYDARSKKHQSKMHICYALIFLHYNSLKWLMSDIQAALILFGKCSAAKCMP